jgi:hypothetical protein
MRGFRDASLGTKLTVLLVTVVVIVLSMSTIAFVINDSRRQRNTLDRQMSTLARMAAENSAVAVGFDIKADVERVLASLAQDRRVEFACVSLSDDGMFKSEDEFASHPTRDDRIPIPKRPADNRPLVEHGYLHVYADVRDPTGAFAVAELYLRVSMDDFRDQRRESATIAMAAFAVSSIVAVLLAYSLRGFILRPILRLAEAAQKVSAMHDYTVRVEETGGDELGTLANGFNSMLAEIQERDAELARHRTDLEALISERTKELEAKTAELQREQYLLNSLVDNVPDPVFFKDGESRFIRANQAMAHDAGFAEPSELLGKSDADIWSVELSAETLDDERRIMETGEPLINKEEQPIRQDGHVRWVLVTKMPLRNEAGEITGTFGIARDITELKKYEQRLEDTNAELHRTNRELDDFAYVASHDLRSPLRAIHNLAKWIGEDAENSLSEQSVGDLEKLLGRVNRMDGLLNGLLQYSRVGRKQYDAEEIDCGAMAREVAELLDRPEEFTIEVTDPMPTIMAQRVPLEQVLRNLIDNAIKHHDRADGRIVIAAEDNGAFVEFSVSDDGRGIAPGYQQKVFQIFETIKTRDEVEGSGMGLALVKKIVESFGGKITLVSDQARGATFRFSWPK